MVECFGAERVDNDDAISDSIGKQSQRDAAMAPSHVDELDRLCSVPTHTNTHTHTHAHARTHTSICYLLQDNERDGNRCVAAHCCLKAGWALLLLHAWRMRFTNAIDSAISFALTVGFG